MPAIESAVAQAALQIVGPILMSLILSGGAWLFLKGVPALIGKLKAGHIRDWLLLSDQIAGNTVLGLSKPALAAAQAALVSGKSTKEAAQAGLDVLLAGVAAKFGPDGIAQLQKQWGDDLSVMLQHTLVASANNPPATATAAQQADAAALAAHLNALTA